MSYYSLIVSLFVFMGSVFDKLPHEANIEGYYVERYLTSKVSLIYESKRLDNIEGKNRKLIDPFIDSVFIPMDQIDDGGISIPLVNMKIDSLSSTTFLFGENLLNEQTHFISESFYGVGCKAEEYERDINACSKNLKEILSFSPYYQSDDGVYLYRIVYIKALVDIMDSSLFPVNDYFNSVFGNKNCGNAIYILKDLMDYSPYILFSKLKIWLPYMGMKKENRLVLPRHYGAMARKAA